MVSLLGKRQRSRAVAAAVATGDTTVVEGVNASVERTGILPFLCF
jgi:hypothetical protein